MSPLALVVDTRLTLATGTAEREAALDMVAARPGNHWITLAADKAVQANDSLRSIRARRPLGAPPRGTDQGPARGAAGMRVARLVALILAASLTACSSPSPVLYTIAPVQGPAQTSGPKVVALQQISAGSSARLAMTGRRFFIICRPRDTLGDPR